MSESIRFFGILIGCAVLYFFAVSWWPESRVYSVGTICHSGTRGMNSSLQNPKKKVLIFAATKFFTSTITSQRFKKCSMKNCFITEDVALLNKSDAVLFHNRDFSSQAASTPRRPGVPFILWSLESPSNEESFPESNFINWTMTYRRDSDIWHPYGRVVRRETPAEINFEEIWKLKNHSLMAVWIGSNCYPKNNRMELIQSMIDHGMQVEIFGTCGKLMPRNCHGRLKQEWKCVTEVVKPYKFYISLENSNCKDYVTEKLFKTMSERMAIPLVIRRQYYEDLKIPRTSFIAIDDFSNMKEFVSYINQVANSKILYLAHHDWRTNYEVLIDDEETGFCELCRRLQKPITFSKSYEDVRKWYSEGMCDNEYTNAFLKASTKKM